MKEFKDKVAVITGAASGIGLAIAERCVREGMKVVLADIEETALTQAEKTLKTTGSNVLGVLTDVSKADEIKALAQQILDTFGAVHLLVNNAGIASGGAIWENTLADWKWVINVNLWGVIHGIKIFVPIMLDQQTECHIVNTSSIAGLNTGQGSGVYRVTKHGVVALSESLYHDLRWRNAKIGVSVLCPGPVSTRIMDSERNRPAGLHNPSIEYTPTPEEVAFREWFIERIRNGTAPEQIVDQVFKAIQENTFYIITHPEYKEAIKLRMEDILQGRNPTLPKRELQ